MEGETLYGRVSFYYPRRGYGFIYTENGTSVYVSSYAFTRKIEKKIVIGTTLRFQIHEKATGLYEARNVEVVRIPSCTELMSLPSGKNIHLGSVRTFGRVSSENAIREYGTSADELKKNGYGKDSLSYVFVRLRNGEEYRFFGHDAPVKGDGQTDLTDYLKSLKRECLYL